MYGLRASEPPFSEKNEKDDSSSGDEEPADAEEGAAYTISEVESSDVTEVQSSSANPVH